MKAVNAHSIRLLKRSNLVRKNMSSSISMVWEDHLDYKLRHKHRPYSFSIRTVLMNKKELGPKLGA